MIPEVIYRKYKKMSSLERLQAYYDVLMSLNTENMTEEQKYVLRCICSDLNDQIFRHE